jgi:hypothetical protein
MYRSIRIIGVLGLALAGVFGTVNASALPQRSDEVQNTRLRWRSGPIRISLSTSLTRANPNIRAGSEVAEAIERSFAAWERAGAPAFELVWSDRQTVSAAGNAGDSFSLITISQTPENLLLFSRDSSDVSARTRVFFNGKGAITEADIVLNPYQQFSTDGSIGTFDLESTLTHEIGHLLGLEHSAVFGATMHDNYGKNGVFSLQSFSARTLSDDDIASLHGLYGAKDDTENCCGVIAGRVLTSAKPGRGMRIWAEDAVTGKVSAETGAAADGGFRLEGLPAGEYRLYAQGTAGSKGALPVGNIGQYTVEKGQTVNAVKRIADRAWNTELRYVGFNYQLSELAVSLNRGKSYTVYLGGRNLDVGKIGVEVNSPYLSVVKDTIESFDYGEGLSVISFEIRVRPETPLGDYSISIRSENGEKRTIIGGLTIEEFVNPWIRSVVTEN